MFARLVPPESMTNRLKVPALAPPPVVAVISVGETTTTSNAGIAVGPAPLPCAISTVAPATKPVPVILIEPHDQLGGRLRSWPVAHGNDHITMSRGFHAFFRQYYNLRVLLRRVDPDLGSLVALPDYPLILAGGYTDSFSTIPRTPPLNIAAFVAQSPSFGLRDLAAVNVPAALELLDVDSAEAPTLYPQHLVLVRPDQHVAWRGDAAPADPLTLIDLVRGSRSPG